MDQDSTSNLRTQQEQENQMEIHFKNINQLKYDKEAYEPIELSTRTYKIKNNKLTQTTEQKQELHKFYRLKHQENNKYMFRVFDMDEHGRRR